MEVLKKRARELIRDYRTWIVIIILVFTFLLVYFPHYNYKYPLHADEFVHLTRLNQFVNNYKPNVIEDAPNFEFGYTLFLTGLFYMEKTLRIDFILAYKFLPAIFALLASFFLFLLMHKLTKNFLISLFSMIFFASLPSDVNLMGLWFAVPLTLSIPFVYLFFLFFIPGIQEANKKLILIATFILAIITLIHPAIGALTFLISFVYITFNYKKLKDNLFSIIIFLPFLGFVSLFFYNFYLWGSTLKTLNYLITEVVVFQQDTTSNLSSEIFRFLGINIIVNPYFLPFLYGFVPFLLAIIGFYISLKEEKLRIFSFWVIVSVSLLFFYKFFDFGTILRIPRITYFALLGLVPLSAIGLERALYFLKTKLENKNVNKKKIFAILIIFFILLFSLTFYSYGKQYNGREIYHIINDKDYEALKFLGQETTKSTVILPLSPAIALYAITGNDAVARDYPPLGETEKKKDVRLFFESNCSGQQSIINKYKINYILSKFHLNCSFKEIYNKTDYIYKIP